jgi:hypothetical protein
VYSVHDVFRDEHLTLAAALFPAAADQQGAFAEGRLQARRAAEADTRNLHILVRSLHGLLTSQTQHWRYEIMITDQLKALHAMKRAILPEVGELLAFGLLSESLNMRRLSRSMLSELMERTKLKATYIPVRPTADGPTIVQRDANEPCTTATPDGALPPVMPGRRADNYVNRYRIQSKDRPPQTPEAYDALIFVDKNYMGYTGWSSDLRLPCPLKEQPPRPVREAAAPRALQRSHSGAALGPRRRTSEEAGAEASPDGGAALSPAVMAQAVLEAAEAETAAMAEQAPLADGETIRRQLDECNGAVLSVLTSEEVLSSYFELAIQEQTGAAQQQMARFDSQHADLWKGLFRNLGPGLLESIKGHVARMCAMTDKVEAQNCAAEILAGLSRGLKHWRGEETSAVWEWLLPLLRTTLPSITNDSVEAWSMFSHYTAWDRDPRRLYPLLDLLTETPISVEGELSTLVQFSRLQMAHFVLSELSWRGHEPLEVKLREMLPMLDHPFQMVRVGLSHLAGLACCYMGELPGEDGSLPGSPTVRALPPRSTLSEFFDAALAPLQAAAERDEGAFGDEMGCQGRTGSFWSTFFFFVFLLLFFRPAAPNKSSRHLQTSPPLRQFYFSTPYPVPSLPSNAQARFLRRSATGLRTAQRPCSSL